MTPLIASIVMMCSPQSDKQIKHTCIRWMQQCIYHQQLHGIPEDQAEENCVEALPQELYPHE